jgi:serine/threonine-protein kinase
MTQQPRLVGGRYELGELIGYGGMAEVHRGRDIRLGREVAIKMLRADLARDPSFLNRFRREAQAAAGLNHPSIVAVYDTGEDYAAGVGGEAAAAHTVQPYIVMEYVAGRTLRDILKTEGALPARRVMEIGADICGALDFSHRAGIVHRDIKPANVMITTAGAVKVMDFGIARAAGDNAATVTQTANVIGTAQYLSPEQARGETVDARSDVYSTGCLLYELATGTPPFQGDSPVAVAYQHVRENPQPASSRSAEVPPALDSVIMKALAKNPVNRYQSAGEMRTDLERALANMPVAAEAVMTDEQRTQLIASTPIPPLAVARAEDEPIGPDPSRRTGLIWLAVILALLLVVGGIATVILVTRSGSNHTAKVQVPNVVGKSSAEAESMLTAQGFTNVSVGAQTNGPCFGNVTVQKDQVCLITPNPGTEVDPTQTSISYQLFTPAQAQVPNVVDLQYNDAANQINAVHLVPKRVPVDNSAPAGQVLSQDPPAYSNQAPGSTVTLRVSTGKVKLPDVSTAHPSFSDAQIALNQAGYTKIVVAAQTVATTDRNLHGHVASQSPTAGFAYTTDTTVTLTLYVYSPPCTTPPAPSTSAAPTSSSASVTPGAASGPASSTPAAAGGDQNNAIASPAAASNSAVGVAATAPNIPDVNSIPTPSCP